MCPSCVKAMEWHNSSSRVQTFNNELTKSRECTETTVLIYFYEKIAVLAILDIAPSHIAILNILQLIVQP